MMMHPDEMSPHDGSGGGMGSEQDYHDSKRKRESENRNGTKQTETGVRGVIREE
jgi:hypothetical protein